MSGYGPLDGLALAAIALSVMLSAFVSLLGTSMRERNVAAGEATSADLAELTGISDPKQILQIFGPPDMGRVWRTVNLTEIHRARTRAGWLISSHLVHYACMASVALAVLVRNPLTQGLVLIALFVQIAGWVLASRMPK